MVLLQVLLLSLLALGFASTPTKVQVQNLGWDTTEDTLREAFERYGTIVDSVLPRDATGRTRGFGFVTFETLEEANAAIAALDEQELDGKIIRVFMAGGQPAEKAERFEFPPDSDINVRYG